MAASIVALAETGSNTRGDVSKGGICLFRIQRVNKTFRDTIQGSTKLKQLIYLAPRDNAKLKDEADLEEGRLALHKPLTAFLWGINFRTKKELLDLDAHKDAEEGVEALVTVLRDSICSGRSTTPYKKIFGKCPKKWRRAQASWRKIKVCNARVPVPVRVVVQGEETWPDHALPMGDIVWDLDEEATLEHVFDLLSEFLKAVEDLRHGKDLHERSRAKKLLQFDERTSSDRHQLESQLAIELKALEDALDREKSTRDDEVARLDAELRDMELKAFGIKASSSREALESQLTIERSYLGREVDEQGFDQGDEITETIRMRLQAVETRRAQRTASESK
ncbi:hypothetical protein CB0940_09229 [Cercospora beticola]|uniref:Uncharacterized protein n=1 Tax=Cercospora beticola TaxID=122368 RepID=A0A2G5HHN1_CERBT|nr:hypothetical protein CB0940_09229 [Cercospora beticola]PIA92061.1 hypothetical protein CB0940_09229 [Cercospora beticola]WPB06467.1 hypothetical protein RHO25_011124 [Cercospora beticola]